MFKPRENSKYHNSYEPSLLAVLERAHKEWLAAERYFHSVTESDLIDHATFLVGAAERKYSYLLKQIRLSKEIEGDDT